MWDPLGDNKFPISVVYWGIATGGSTVRTASAPTHHVSNPFSLAIGAIPENEGNVQGRPVAFLEEGKTLSCAGACALV